MSIESERNRFEEWASNRLNLERFDEDDDPSIASNYVDDMVDLAWSAWQEALPCKIKTVHNKKES